MLCLLRMCHFIPPSPARFICHFFSWTQRRRLDIVCFYGHSTLLATALFVLGLPLALFSLFQFDHDIVSGQLMAFLHLISLFCNTPLVHFVFTFLSATCLYEWFLILQFGFGRHHITEQADRPRRLLSWHYSEQEDFHI